MFHSFISDFFKFKAAVPRGMRYTVKLPQNSVNVNVW